MNKELQSSQQLENLVNFNKKFNKMLTPIIKYVGFGDNCPSIGWIFPCIKCLIRTSKEAQVGNTKCSLCFHCRNNIKAYIITNNIGISVDKYFIQNIITNLEKNNNKYLFREIREY